MKIWTPPLGERVVAMSVIHDAHVILVATCSGVYLLDEQDLCGVAQSVERCTHNAEVAGASPAPATNAPAVRYSETDLMTNTTRIFYVCSWCGAEVGPDGHRCLGFDKATIAAVILNAGIPPKS